MRLPLFRSSATQRKHYRSFKFDNSHCSYIHSDLCITTKLTTCAWINCKMSRFSVCPFQRILGTNGLRAPYSIPLFRCSYFSRYIKVNKTNSNDIRRIAADASLFVELNYYWPWALRFRVFWDCAKLLYGHSVILPSSMDF